MSGELSAGIRHSPMADCGCRPADQKPGLTVGISTFHTLLCYNRRSHLSCLSVPRVLAMTLDVLTVENNASGGRPS